MPKGGFQTITVKDETYCALKDYAGKINRSPAETIHSLLRGLADVEPIKDALTLNFYQEYVCLDCGCRSQYPIEKCRICGGTVGVRYVVEASHKKELVGQLAH